MRVLVSVCAAFARHLTRQDWLIVEDSGSLHAFAPRRVRVMLVCDLSRISEATIAPERNDSAATISMAHANPRESAMTPAESAPTA
jgi:hypothetical protein